MKYADYIKEIEIDALWGGRKHIKWTLDPHVNVLSGVNGDGKSTILRRAITGARAVGTDAQLRLQGKSAEVENGIRIVTEPADAEYVRYNWICTPDVRSEYDENLMSFVERYNSSMVQGCNSSKVQGCNSSKVQGRNSSRETFEPLNQQSALNSSNPGLALLHDIIDDLFKATHKTVDREKREFVLNFYGEPIDLKVLSSGEKQMLTILLAVYLENEEHYVLFMDEPEVSLHVEWQKKLISIIRKLNPNVQIILSTHSPAMIMDGWMDKVTEVSEITIHN